MVLPKLVPSGEPLVGRLRESNLFHGLIQSVGDELMSLDARANVIQKLFVARDAVGGPLLDEAPDIDQRHMAAVGTVEDGFVHRLDHPQWADILLVRPQEPGPGPREAVEPMIAHGNLVEKAGMPVVDGHGPLQESYLTVGIRPIQPCGPLASKYGSGIYHPSMLPDCIAVVQA